MVLNMCPYELSGSTSVHTRTYTTSTNLLFMRQCNQAFAYIIFSYIVCIVTVFEYKKSTYMYLQQSMII